MTEPVILSSRDDARLAPFVDLRHAKRRGDHFIAEGRLAVRRLLQSAHRVESLVVQQGVEHEFASELNSQTSLYALPPDELKALVGFDFHRGVLACGKRPKLPAAEQLAFKEGDTPVALAAIGVSDADNLGSMIRSAAGFGIRHILVGPGTIDPYSRRVIRVSMANVFETELYDLSQPLSQLPQLSDRTGIQSLATTLADDAIDLDRWQANRRPHLILVGNEYNGLSQAIASAADQRITIPMKLGTDSLNVAVAAALFMYTVTGRIEQGRGV